ncbi:fibronectin type III domain-containing protein [Geomonas sp.]|uniref:fibronectin type III domain-containing protein n=1 Tax=Geomonas sp. TaxID=2651584 RepID=UPI002B493E0C|nr:fibronectin type III domain-containing protein [Geomonas sp.]HJV37192.1 fibronectin type III domain-containing protein [Geomonas sp.]
MRQRVNSALARSLFALLALAGCGGGGSPNSAAPPSNSLSVIIDPPSYDTSAVASTAVDLRGQTTCDACPKSETAFGGCPPILPPQTSSISVSWKNRTTGAAGEAYHGIVGSCACLFSYCTTSYSHKWAAYGVPIAPGENIIDIIAAGAGSSGSSSLKITRIPSTPQGLAIASAKGEVTLQWDGVSGATSYNLYWSTSPTLTKQTATKIAGVSSPYTHAGLTDDTTYYYFVTAVNGAYESSESPTVFASPGWISQTVASTTAAAEQRSTSLAIDSAGITHVNYAYSECTNYGTLPTGDRYCSTYSYHNNYLTDFSGAWISQPAPSSFYIDAGIAVDSDDTVHLSYLNRGVVHAVFSAGSWVSEVVDPLGWCGSSIAVDSSKHVSVAYMAGTSSGNDIRYGTNSSGAWSTGVVSTSSQDAGCTLPSGRLSLAVDPAGAAQIAYAGPYPGYGVKYATDQGGRWVIQTVDSCYVQSLASAVDGNGRGHVAYNDNTGQIRYAHQDAAGGWGVEVIESSGALPGVSLALDAAGNAYISYLTYGGLRFAANAGGSWRIIALDGNAGADTAIALDSLGNVHISYFDASGNLKDISNR